MCEKKKIRDNRLNLNQRKRMCDGQKDPVSHIEMGSFYEWGRILV